MSGKTEFTAPPTIFSREQIGNWVKEEIDKAGLKIPYRIVDTAEWEHYVNYDHFVPGTIEGLPAGYKFDYNWTPGKPHKGVPAAEITEEGKLIVWWQRCNWHELKEEQCKTWIQKVVSHEGFHYAQWQRIAVNVLTTLGYTVTPQNIPANMEELGVYSGAKEAFMRIWANGAHYQCREVEAYTADFRKDADAAKDPIFNQLLEGLYIYVYGSEYSQGCANSIWANEFKEFIKEADELFLKHNTGRGNQD